MKNTTICFLLFVSFFTCHAQEDTFSKTYKDFKKQSRQSYQEFVDKQNRDFINFLKQSWVKFKLEKPELYPTKPEPTQPIKFDKNKQVDIPTEVGISEFIKLPASLGIQEQLKKPTLLNQPDKWVSVNYYGSIIHVDNSLKDVLRIDNLTEEEIAKGWEVLCHASYKTLISDCLNIKNYFQMNDWGYVAFCGKLAIALCGPLNKNEKILMQLFILSQSGYKAKMARAVNQLVLMIVTDCKLYATSYLKLNGVNYYIIQSGEINNEIHTYQKDFGNANQAVCMQLLRTPILRFLPENYLHQTTKGAITIQAQVNKALMAFYKDYPQCDFLVYAQAAPSNEFIETVLFPLKNAIIDKNEIEAANLLLNFVQTAFEYQTDDNQFGYEKPFFVDETFYYPYCDCEDRAILYQYLVKTLLNLDVVLLNYPEHLAVAVRFSSFVEGDYIMIDNKRYTVCDPTYINAPIGCAMPQFKKTKVIVIQCDFVNPLK